MHLALLGLGFSLGVFTPSSASLSKGGLKPSAATRLKQHPKPSPKLKPLES